MYMDYNNLLDGTANRELETFLKKTFPKKDQDQYLREYGEV